MQRRSNLLLVVWLIAAIGRGPVSGQADSRPAAGQLGDLSITVGITPGIIDWFNQNARPNDIAAFFGPSVSLIDQVTAGQKIVLYPSAATAEQEVPALAGKINMIGYDIEHWPQTPQDEQADPVSAIKRMRALADKYGLKLGVGPDRAYAQQYGAQFAPYVDQFTLQLQKLQTNNIALQSFATPVIDQIHQVNSKVRIIVQLRTDAGVEGLIQTANSIKSQIDVVGVLFTPQTVNVVKDFVTKLRSGQPAPTGTAATITTASDTVTPTSTVVPASPTALPTRAPISVVVPTPTLLPAAATTSGVETLLVIIILLLVLIIAGLTGYLWQRTKRPRNLR